MECPYINKNIILDKYNKPINYKDVGGSVDYTYYKHDDGFGGISLVQFCNLMGR